MKTTEITIEVEPGTAKLYLSASEQQKRQLNLLLSLYIQDANGLTPENLEKLLRDE